MIQTKGKKRVAILFGGRSPEHDVSIVTGLQVLHAIDTNRYDPIPIYISLDGTWFVGEPLFERRNYLPDAGIRKQLTPVILNLNPGNEGFLHPIKRSVFHQTKPIKIDVAVPAFHGLIGEDGQLQGVFETANIPYTGMRTLASSIFMDKAVTKHVLSGTGIPLLPCKIVEKPQQGSLLSASALAELTEGVKFPCCIKPSHLGSSIGLALVNNPEELNAVLPHVFQYDTSAVLEPYVDSAIEYNVSVRRENNRCVTSAIERPKRTSELLDFKQKYLSGGAKAEGKMPGTASQGMLSLTRELNPKLDERIEKSIRQWATIAYEVVNGTGAPRIDFLCNERTNEIWLNEVNPIPGSFAYFLWEAAEQPVLFTELLNSLIEEAVLLHERVQIPLDPTPEEARLFKRK